MTGPVTVHRASHRASVPPLALLGALAAGDSISGSALANRLGISRAAVWKQVEALRELGLDITARAGHGYRLDAPLGLLDARQIGDAMAAPARTALGDLAVHWQIDSTSSELLRRAGADPRDRLACLAEVQHAGRGRRGRAWRMPLGGGIALSFLKRFEDGMAPLAGLSLIVGLSAVQALADVGIRSVALKWPNDLVAGGRKLAGILVELGGDAIGPCHAVIGIGLNVGIGARGAPAIDQPWTDLAALAAGPTPSRNVVAARLLERLIDALDRFAEHGFAAVADDYAHHDALYGRPVRVLRGTQVDCGIARGVDARGALQVEFADGLRSIDSGDVSVREDATEPSCTC